MPAVLYIPHSRGGLFHCHAQWQGSDYAFMGILTHVLLVVDGSGTCPLGQYASLQVESSCYIMSHMSCPCPCPGLAASGGCAVHAQSYQRSAV